MLMHAYRNKSRLALIALLLVLTFAIVPAAHAQSGWYTVKIENASRFDIYKVFLSPSENNRWGRDLLGSHALVTGYVLTTPQLASGRYDLKLVDEDGDVCVVSGVAIYGDTNWRITNSWLLHCEFH